MALQPQNERPFGFRDKLGYLFGDFGNDFTFIFAGSYLTLFYTDVLGANCAGVYAILVSAIDNHTIWLRLRHVLELPVIFFAIGRNIQS